MTWRKEIEELQVRTRMAHAMGDADKIERHRAAGKLTVRERIEALLDPRSFREIGTLAGKADYDEEGRLRSFTAGNILYGLGRIDGREVVVTGDDYTIRGGAADASVPGKYAAAEQLANEYRLPLVRLLDGTGGSVRTIEAIGRTYISQMDGWAYSIDNLATAPCVSLVLGSVAGIGAARAATSHYALMVRGTSHMFIAGPPVVARAGNSYSKDELGGAAVHEKSGAVDDVVDDEREAFARTRRFLSYLPASVDELPPRIASDDPASRRDEKLAEIVPRDRRRVYRMRDIIERVVDHGSFFEMTRNFGKPVITGLARFDGWPVALMAGDPYHYGGAWTADACRKVIRFVDLAQTFHLPVVYLMDCPGLLIGKEAEEAGTIRAGCQALAATHQATVPWCTIIVRKCFGVGGAAHANTSRYPFRFAWPSGDWGSIPAEGGIEAAYRAELDAATDRAAKLDEIVGRIDRLRSPFRSAEAFNVEEIVDPRDTRPLICRFANLAAPLRKPGRMAATYRP